MFLRHDDCVVGVLNDWDLAAPEVRTSAATSAHRTGTAVFMALELLEDPEDTPFHEYRHDLESFGWILIWCAFVLEFKGKEVPWQAQYDRIKPWVGADKWANIGSAKLTFVTKKAARHYEHVTPAMQPLVEDWIKPVLSKMAKTFLARNMASALIDMGDPAPSPVDDFFMFTKFMAILESNKEAPAVGLEKE